MRRFRLVTILGLAVGLAAVVASSWAPPAPPQPAAGRFQFRDGGFMLDGKPVRLMAGEMHFQRIPRECWADRLAKARAMGLNTLCTYVFWNALEPSAGRWDFTGRNDVAAFIRQARRAGLWVVLRPGPYACAEWDFGGLPSRLLAIPDIKVRCSDPRYLAACESYVRRLASEVRDLMADRGGPILMVQLENEYGSYGNDLSYMRAVRAMWQAAGVAGPFCTADGASPAMLEAGTVPGAAIGLDPGVSAKDFAEAEKLGRGVPVFCSELYPGWLTHWGEPWARVATDEVVLQARWLLENGKSFSLYVVHGGTNFGFWAGANFGEAYQPDVTSYDYDAPIDEAGRPTPKYFALRDLLRAWQPEGTALPDVPASRPLLEIPAIETTRVAPLFANLPEPIRTVQPRPIEAFGQAHGFALYRTRMVAKRSGRLTIVEPHDFASVYADGTFLGTVDRRLGQTGIDVPAATPPADTLNILVEAMGRINYGDRMIDRKGITDRVTLDRMVLMDWEIVPLPMDAAYLKELRWVGGCEAPRPAAFFGGTFELADPGDTYLDMGGWGKGVVWVNGNNLGRYWDIGPQKRLYCPAPFLKSGSNEIIVFEMLKTTAGPIRGVEKMED